MVKVSLSGSVLDEESLDGWEPVEELVEVGCWLDEACVESVPSWMLLWLTLGLGEQAASPSPSRANGNISFLFFIWFLP